MLLSFLVRDCPQSLHTLCPLQHKHAEQNLCIVPKHMTLLSASSTPSQVVFLAIAVAFFGVPHGATDHLVGYSFFKPAFGQLWLPIFGLLHTQPAAPHPALAMVYAPTA